jgi:hypothetical protein
VFSIGYDIFNLMGSVSLDWNRDEMHSTDLIALP